MPGTLLCEVLETFELFGVLLLWLEMFEHTQGWIIDVVDRLFPSQERVVRSRVHRVGDGLRAANVASISSY